MLREFVEKKHYKFAAGAETWQEAVRMSCESLEADGTVNAQYAEEIYPLRGKIRPVHHHYAGCGDASFPGGVG